MTYFNPTPTTCEALKKAYRELTLKWHPDVTGQNTDKEMAGVNLEYKTLFEMLKDIHVNAAGEVYTASKPTTEVPEQFIDIMDMLVRFEGVLVEIIGCFVWVSGNTKPYKEMLKEMGFKWSSNKTSWYLSPPGYRRRASKDYGLNEIRNMFGNQVVETEEKVKLDQ